jgi:hypothetical protein
MFSRVSLGLLFTSILLSASSSVEPAAVAAPTACTFNSGFRALRDQLPEVVGDCLDDEHRDAANGNVEQHTTGGLLTWQPAANLVAFSDGQTTWLLGPDGLVNRPNAGPPFPWEAAISSAAVPTPSPSPTPVPSVDVRELALTEADLPPGLVRNVQASKYEELPTGGARVVAVFEGPVIDAVLNVVERYPDPSAAADALRALHPAAFPAITLGLMARRDQDWEEVGAPAVGALNRAFRVRQPAVLILPDSRVGSAALGWRWAQRGSFVYGVGMHAGQAQAALDGSGPLIRLIDSRVQQRLNLTSG